MGKGALQKHEVAKLDEENIRNDGYLSVRACCRSFVVGLLACLAASRTLAQAGADTRRRAASPWLCFAREADVPDVGLPNHRQGAQERAAAG